MEGYTFEDMWMDLKNGYQIYYTYVRNRYVLFKTAQNCYTQKLLSDNPKNPQPRMTMLTLKRVQEMFPYMEDIEYKIGISDDLIPEKKLTLPEYFRAVIKENGQENLQIELEEWIQDWETDGHSDDKSICYMIIEKEVTNYK